MIRNRLLPGLALTASVAVVAMALGGIGWFSSHGLSALTVAIVLGILLGNSLYPHIAARSGSGVAFSKQTLLRAGIVLYGLRLTLHDIGHVGVAGVLIDALVILTTFGLAHLLGRLIGLDRTASSLIGAGSEGRVQLNAKSWDLLFARIFGRIMRVAGTEESFVGCDKDAASVINGVLGSYRKWRAENQLK